MAKLTKIVVGETYRVVGWQGRVENVRIDANFHDGHFLATGLDGEMKGARLDVRAGEIRAPYAR